MLSADDKDKDEILEAIRDANPLWLPRLVNAAYQMMPTSYTYAFDEGSPQYDYAEADHLHNWTTWAVSIGVLPEDTEIPPAPAGTLDASKARRVSAPQVRGATQSAAPAAYYMPAALSVAQRNGVWPPKKDSAGERIWQLCEQLKTSLARLPTVQEVQALEAAAALTESIPSEYQRWCKYVA